MGGAQPRSVLRARVAAARQGSGFCRHRRPRRYWPHSSEAVRGAVADGRDDFIHSRTLGEFRGERPLAGNDRAPAVEPPLDYLEGTMDRRKRTQDGTFLVEADDFEK